MAKVFIDPQPTPNPNAMKFNVSQPVTQGGSESYSSKEAAEASPLAARIFALEGVAGVFMLGNFVTVNKDPGASWNELVPSVMDLIDEHLSQ